MSVALRCLAVVAIAVGLACCSTPKPTRSYSGVRSTWVVPSTSVTSAAEKNHSGMVLPSPDTSSTQPVPAHPDPLGMAAESYLSGRAGQVEAAVFDLDTNQLWTVGPQHPQAEASIVKVNILEALIWENSDVRNLSSGDLSLAQSMIEYSDNTAATDLWDLVRGAAGLSSYNDRAGLASTTPSPCVVCPGFPWPGWGLSTTTSADQILLLRQLVEPSSLLNSAAQMYVLQLMENVTVSERWGISGGVPAQVIVALKNGWLPLSDDGTNWQINSIGWVSGLGRNYLIAVLSTGNPTETYGINTINGLSTIVWGALA
jgi:beta-lactamase class A